MKDGNAFAEINQALGIDITKIEILKSAGKRPKYQFYFRGFEDPVTMDSGQVLSRTKFAERCCLNISPLPQTMILTKDVWYRLVNNAVQEAKRIQVS